MTPDHESLDSNHGHEYPVRELRVLPSGYLMCLSGSMYLDPYAPYTPRCVTVSHTLAVSLPASVSQVREVSLTEARSRHLGAGALLVTTSAQQLPS